MRQMLTPHEAQSVVLASVSPLATEPVALEAALGRTLARDAVSTLQLPPFDNSAMDGYAVRARETQGASETSPRRLPVPATVAAGNAERELPLNSALRIMTGAPLPRGADGVIMREETREREAEVELLASCKPGQNVRRAGSDLRVGEVAVRAGTRLRPAEVGLLASLGLATVEVFRAPRVGVLVTGNELARVGDELRDGQIRDSNSWTLGSLARELGASVQLSRCGDAPEEFEAALRELSDCDAIVTSGGVSMGDFDPVRDVLPRVADVLFWKIAMKPGKPVMFARWRVGARDVPVFGLPGNPVSVMVAWELLARPALLKMSARANLFRPQVPARVDAGFSSPSGRAEFARVLVSPQADGIWQARLSGDQSSGRLTTMARSNALLQVPSETTRVEAGDVLPALLTDLLEVE